MKPRSSRQSIAGHGARLASWLIALSLGTGAAVGQASDTRPPGAPPPPAQAPAAASGVLHGEIQARIDKVVTDFANEPRFKGMTDKQRRDLIEFVAGNVIFATVHEVGHMLIAEMGLPVLGREEDAADAFAAITGLRLGGSFSDTTLRDSALGWFMSDRRNQAQHIQNAFYDEHGLDKQRAYNIVCLMVGGNPEKFGELAEMTKMPAERQGTCQGDFSNASWSWNKVLEPHLRKADQPKTEIDVKYVPTTKYEIYERGFREIKLLETLADHLSDRYAWRRPIGLEMAECNEPAAHWDLSARKITVCYELGYDFAALYREFGEPMMRTAPVSAGKRKR